MAGLNMEIRQERRSAVLQVSEYWKKQYELSADEMNVSVLGIYQVSDEDHAEPMFICELPDGRCLFAQIEKIRFTGE